MAFMHNFGMGSRASTFFVVSLIGIAYEKYRAFVGKLVASRSEHSVRYKAKQKRTSTQNHFRDFPERIESYIST